MYDLAAVHPVAMVAVSGMSSLTFSGLLIFFEIPVSGVSLCGRRHLGISFCAPFSRSLLTTQSLGRKHSSTPKRSEVLTPRFGS
jgi:hypothetical protein